MLNYKKHNFNKVSLPIIFLRDIYKKNVSIENADIEQINLFKKLNNLNQGKKIRRKSIFSEECKNSA